VSFFSEERASELKELFFESATELLQALNEEGLELEKRPGDAEVVRGVRRTVHTLKGDSAACGYNELSELAHILEDVLTPELAASANGRVAEVVLEAADIFEQMLNAYRSNSGLPRTERIRENIKGLVAGVNGHGISAPVVAAKFTPKFAWTEYEQMVIADATKRGLKVLQLAMRLDPSCLVRAAAVQMVKTALQDLGNLLVIVPEDPAPTEIVEQITAALATSFDLEYVTKKCKIPAVISDVHIERLQSATAEPVDDLLGLLNDTHIAPETVMAAPVVTPTVPEAAPGHEPQEQTEAASKLHESSLRVDAERIDAVLNLVGELIIGKSMLTQTISDFEKRFTKDPLKTKFSDALAFQARVLNDLQKSVMKIRMVPVEQLFRRFPRTVRDVAKAVGKEVELEMTGQDTDLDKSILDSLAEPLSHLVRNAVDHGLEIPQQRIAAGKPVQGTVRLNAFHQGNQIVIEVSDDGAGINRERLVAKAIERGIVTQEDVSRMTEAETLNLIFHPGLSTAEQVTAISGRGVGMDVVKTVIERLKGSVTINTRAGQGTSFCLKVPLTLAIIKALLFHAGERLYAVPLSSVVEITRAKESDVHKVDQHEVLRLREEVLTLVRLNKLSRKKENPHSKIFVVVITLAERKFGLVVDKLMGEEELVIKALDDHLVATDLVSGASILGDGTVVLILNVQAVVQRLGRNGHIEAKRMGATA
jgi:two-component system chemotaxis sensor kinase CheA